ncbi:hypothetical protein ACFXGI_07280 [Streptomyces sp. NPDC059355]|uniref:hypothetical protein n=1 Tax=Streptomyces sp. NPDC059355 TaxID=3346811 RepID=UPI0036A5627E
MAFVTAAGVRTVATAAEVWERVDRIAALRPGCSSVQIHDAQFVCHFHVRVVDIF